VFRVLTFCFLGAHYYCGPLFSSLQDFDNASSPFVQINAFLVLDFSSFYRATKMADTEDS
jgi:hypothetical protein